MKTCLSSPKSELATAPVAAEDLLSCVYHELRMLAKRKLDLERIDHTLQPTALVHEAFLRLFGDCNRQWSSVDSFFAAAAQCMRRILVDSARAKRAQKRGGVRHKIRWESLDTKPAAACLTPQTILEIDDLLTQLADLDPQAADLMQLRIFTGLSVTEAGRVMHLPRSTAYDIWSFGRAWFATKYDSPS